MRMLKIDLIVWRILLGLIFLRPFISEHAFPFLGFWYIFGLILFSSAYLMLCPKRSFPPPLFSIPILSFLAVILISLLLSGCATWGIVELCLFIPGILIFYIVSTIEPKQQGEVIRAMFFAACIIGIYAIYQYFFGLRHTLDYIKQACPNSYAQELLSKRRVFATFISPNIFVSYILMMFFSGLGFALSRRAKKEAHWPCVFVMASALVLAQSLGGILTFLAASVLFLVLGIFYLGPGQRLKKINFKKAGLAVILLLSVLFAVALVFTVRRLTQFCNMNDPNNSIIQRLYYWQASLNMIKQHPLVGIGWRKFGLLYDCYKLQGANTSRYAHNAFLQIAAETGILGLLSFLGIIFAFCRSGLEAIKKNGAERPLKIGLFCGGCAFLIHNLVDLSFYFGQVSFFWWVILGLFVTNQKNVQPD